MPYLSKKYLNETFDKRQQTRSIYDSHLYFVESNSVFNKNDTYDVFLSYSFSDKEYAYKIYTLMKEAGYKVYIDLKDARLDRDDVDEETAKRIAEVMNHCKCLVYVHSASAKVSKWCPWELGYMSGRTNFRCALIPLLEDKEDFPHQEYLGLYPIVDYGKDNKGFYEFWVNKYKTSKYVSLKGFINGENPKEH